MTSVNTYYWDCLTTDWAPQIIVSTVAALPAIPDEPHRSRLGFVADEVYVWSPADRKWLQFAATPEYRKVDK